MPPKPATARNVYVFGLTSLLNDTASEMAYWILPAFLATLGAGPMQLGLIEGVAEGVASGAKLLSGWLSDRFPRRKPMVVGGYAVANLAKPLLALATAWWHIFLIRFADRFAKGMRGAPRDVLLAESVSKKDLGSAYGLMQAMDTTGAILGPLLALWLVARFADPRTVFLFAAIPGVLSIVVVALFARETGGAKHLHLEPAPPDPDQHLDVEAAPPAPAPEKTTHDHIPASFYFLLFAVTLFSLGGSSDMFLILRARDVGITVAEAPILGLVFNIVYALTSWPAGKLSDRLPKAVVAAAGYIVYAVTYYVFAKAPSATAIWITMAGYGLFYALTTPVLKALIAEAVPAALRGRALGLFYFASSISMLLASLLAGELWEHFGAPAPFYLSSALAAIAAVLLLVQFAVTKTSRGARVAP